jgi:hypothetical protein
VKILELPFHERPARELLNLDGERAEPDYNYAGYGWARVGDLWLDRQHVRDALVLGLHTADDADAIADDIDLEFELPNAPPVAVLASVFLDKWLPELPAASSIVLALCNPHNATLRRPAAATAPVYYATGDVTSWLDHDDDGDRIRLAADGSWVRLPA